MNQAAPDPLRIADALQAENEALRAQLEQLEAQLAQAERRSGALAESEERYSELLRISPYGVMVQVDGRITYINERGLQILGAGSIHQVVGCRPSEFIDSQSEEVAWARDMELSDHGQTTPQRFRLRRCDGGVSDVEVASVRFQGEEGYAIQTVFQDITERLKLEQDAQAYAERYRIIDELSSDYIYLDRILPDGMMEPLWVTHAFERMTGYTVEEAKNSELLTRLAHPDDLGPFLEHYAQLLQGKVGDFTGRLVRKDGAVRWIRHMAWPVMNHASGRVELLYGCVRDVTDWMEAAAQAKDYSERYSIISELSEDFNMLGKLRPDGQIEFIWVTEAFERMTGYTLAETSEEGFLRSILPADPEHSLRRQLEVLQANLASSAEGPLTTRWGATLWVRSTMRPFPDPVTGETLVFASVRDITRRRMAEEALRGSEQQLRAAQRVGKIGSWELNVPEESLIWSAQMYDIYGVDLELFTPSYATVMELIRPEDRVRLDTSYEQAVAGSDAYTIEFNINPPGGGTRVIHVRAELARDAHGAVERVFGTAQDVTEMREKERALQAAYVALEETNRRLEAEVAERLSAVETLRESEERYRRLLESMEEGVILADFNEIHLYANRAAEKIYGVGPGELINRSIGDFVDAATFEGFRHQSGIRMGGEHSVYDFEITRPDGQRRRLRNSVAPVRNAAGEVVASMGVFSDITEQEALRERLQTEQREESILMLAGGIAHDFNNMLMGVLGASTMIESSLAPDDEDTRELARAINTSATRMADLTSKLLAYARGGKYQTRKVDVNHAVRNASLMLRGNLPARVQIELDLEAELAEVDADMGQLEQVLLNLLINAIEAIEANETAAGLVRVTTSLDPPTLAHMRPAAAAHIGPAVRVSVVDTGVGMSAETLARVFEPFYSTKFQGRGLGLAACSGIVRNHGGVIWAESAPGQGSAFHLLLPQAHGPSVPAREEAEQTVTVGSNVLVIDDDPDALHVITRMLESRGYAVSTASSGSEGLALAAERTGGLDLVILDMQMPDLSGAEVLRQLREATPGLRVLIASGYAPEDALKSIAGLPISGFISKPFGPKELTRAVETALANPAG